MLALILAFSLAQLALPYVNQLFDIQLRIDIFQDVYLLAFLPILLVVVILLSGSYPGLVLAGFQPVLALKGKLSQKHVGGFLIEEGIGSYPVRNFAAAYYRYYRDCESDALLKASGYGFPERRYCDAAGT